MQGPDPPGGQPPAKTLAGPTAGPARQSPHVSPARPHPSTPATQSPPGPGSGRGPHGRWRRLWTGYAGGLGTCFGGGDNTLLCLSLCVAMCRPGRTPVHVAVDVAAHFLTLVSLGDGALCSPNCGPHSGLEQVSPESQDPPPGGSEAPIGPCTLHRAADVTGPERLAPSHLQPQLVQRWARDRSCWPQVIPRSSLGRLAFFPTGKD